MVLSFQQSIEFRKQIYSSLGTKHICKLIFYLLGHVRWQSELQQTYPGCSNPDIWSNMGQVWYDDAAWALLGKAAEAFSWTTKTTAADVSHLSLLWLVEGLSNCCPLIRPIENKKMGTFQRNAQLQIGLAISSYCWSNPNYIYSLSMERRSRWRTGKPQPGRTTNHVNDQI